MNNQSYTPLAKAQIQDNRNLVISSYFRGGYTIAQQVAVMDNNYTTTVTLKGAFHIPDISGLYNLRDALNVAIKKIEKEENIS